MSLIREKSLPNAYSDLILIENPNNEHEIFLFGGYKSTHLFIYNIKQDTFKQLTSNIDYFYAKFDTVMFIGAVSGIIEHTIIAFGLTWHPIGSFYVIFNCKTLQFDQPIYSKTRRIFHGHGCRIHGFKKWLFVTGGDIHTNNKPNISIFEIISINNILRFKLLARKELLRYIFIFCTLVI